MIKLVKWIIKDFWGSDGRFEGKFIFSPWMSYRHMEKCMYRYFLEVVQNEKIHFKKFLDLPQRKLIRVDSLDLA